MYTGERILKIVQHLAKSWARVGCPVFYILVISIIEL